MATDARGNASNAAVFTFTLDTQAPQITLANTGIQDGGTLTAGMHLTGTADPTGSNLISLTYKFTGDALIPVAFNATTGAFDQALDLSRLQVGPQVLTVTARDAAGNETVTVLNVTVPELVPLRVTGITPVQGATEVGVTYRPRVMFSRAINTSTLTPDSFYATNSSGKVLPAVLLPTADRMSVWMLFSNPLPSAATVTLHVIGSKIRGAADGKFLDAANNGIAGSTLTVSYTTVSTSVVPGTVLQGKVLDPGPDLLPMTNDDIKAGPDNSLFTADNVYLTPIVHAKVYILGLEDQAVFTDNDGNFTLLNVPSGNVKVVVDGNTATNAPAGYYFPEMVMDFRIKPGILNTLMSSMGSNDKQAARQGNPATYLPRLQQIILNNISDTDPTTVTTPVSAGAGSGMNVTGDEVNSISLTVQPGSLVDANGDPLTHATIGVSPVPASLVADMLPPGLLEHSFDITIQAPGAAVFNTPATLTMPNTFGAAPGTKLSVLSFDHTTGRLVIDGTATVSADGKTVTTDPGQGIIQPGWHGLAPPGGCGASGGPPPMPTPPSPTEMVTEHDPVALNLITGDSANQLIKSFNWDAPPQNPDVPPLPPIPGCDVPQHNPDTEQQPFTNVTIEIDGPLGDFAKAGAGSIALAGQSFTLSPGSASKKLVIDAKSYAEIFGADGFKNLLHDQLYGSKIKITVIEQKPNGDRTRDIYTYYVDRWVDAVDANQAKNKTGATAAFVKTLVDGAGNFVRDKFVDAHLPTSVTTDYMAAAPFMVADPGSGDRLLLWEFDPTSAGDFNSTKITIKVNDPKLPNSGKVGELTTVAKAINPTKLSLNLDDADGYKAELTRVINALQNVIVGQGPDGKFGTTDDVYDIVYDFGGGVITVPNPSLADPNSTGAAMITGVTDFSKVKIASSRFKSLFAEYMPNFVGPPAQSLADRVAAEADALLAAVQADFAFLGNALTLQRTNAGADVVMSWKDLGPGLYGGTSKYRFQCGQDA